MTDDEDPWADRESGPFCRHWTYPSDCDEMCQCGHECRRHKRGDSYGCEDCACDGFVAEEGS